MKNDFVIETENNDPMGKAHNGIELPFPVLYVAWRYGNKELADLGNDNAKYTGGWSINSESLDNFREKSGMNAFSLPLNWKPARFKGDKGKSDYDAFLSKRAEIVVVSSRARAEQFDKQGKMTKVAPAYTKGMKTKTQYLCIMKADDIAVPIVMSLASYKQSSFRQCWDEYRNASKDFCKQFSVPYYRFWVTLGIDVPKFETVGEGTNSKDITKIQLVAYPQNEQEFKGAYIGGELIEYVKELQMKSDAWKNDAAWLGQKEDFTENNIDPNEPDFMKD